MTVFEIVVLYLAFRAKQLIGDYLLQTQWMATGKTEDIKALLAHAAVHGAFTFLIVILFAPSLWWLGLVDIVVHATIDAVKERTVKRHGWQMTDFRFWWAHGFDQEAHNLTHLIFIIVIAVASGGIG